MSNNKIRIVVVSSGVLAVLVLALLSFNRVKNSTEAVKTDMPASSSSSIIDVEKIFATFPAEGSSGDEINAWRENIKNLSIETEILDVTGCKPNPIIIRIKRTQALTIKNTDNYTHNIYHGPTENPEIHVEVLPNSENVFTLKFPDDGFFGYKCDNQRVGIFFVTGN